jgi:hypothetical protein
MTGPVDLSVKLTTRGDPPEIGLPVKFAMTGDWGTGVAVAVTFGVGVGIVVVVVVAVGVTVTVPVPVGVVPPAAGLAKFADARTVADPVLPYTIWTVAGSFPV